MKTMLMKVVSKHIKTFGVTLVVCSFYKLSHYLLILMKKKFCGSKHGHRTIYGRGITCGFDRWWYLTLMRGRTLFWKCIKRLGTLENNKHLLIFVSSFISTIGLNKSKQWSRLVKNAS